MKNLILEHPLFYRMYQNIVRIKKDEYLFFNYIFSQIKEGKKIRVLDICSGDSHILKYINNHISDYLAIDFNHKYLKNLSSKWPKYNFINSDIREKKTLSILKRFKPNFIFVNGAIHHLDNDIIKSINSIILHFKDSYFLSVDPVKYQNKIINNLMIYFDRGKYIRSKNEYHKLMKGFNSIIIDDFYKMSFKNIFHYRNFNLRKYYKNWKKII